MENKKTHYRKVFKSDHLGTPDLEEFIEDGKSLVFTISHVKQEIGTKVAGKKIDANIAYFKEGIKPLVLNSTNSKQVAKFAKSSFVEDWNNISIELYIDSAVKMKGQIVGGVRIRPVQPQPKKAELTPNHPRWEEARQAVKDGKLNGVLSIYEVSDVNVKLLQA